MIPTPEHDERMARMRFSTVYPLYLQKIEKKGRTKAELDQAIEWLTGFDSKKIAQMVSRQVTFQEFFDEAHLNANAIAISGVICGYRIEDIPNPLTRSVRYMDKLVDELAKGKKMEKILR